MPLFCFCYPNLPMFTDVLSIFSGRTSCFAYIFMGGKQIQYVGPLFPYIPVIKHVRKIS